MANVVKLDKLVERGIRSSLSDLTALPLAERSAALKIAIDFLKYQRAVKSSDELGFEFQKADPEDEK
ncbi:MAG: hypothetical protein ACYDCJ_12860 [Gammaproteobacteria bacterium]